VKTIRKKFFKKYCFLEFTLITFSKKSMNFNKKFIMFPSNTQSLQKPPDFSPAKPVKNLSRQTCFVDKIFLNNTNKKLNKTSFLGNLLNSKNVFPRNSVPLIYPIFRNIGSGKIHLSDFWSPSMKLETKLFKNLTNSFLIKNFFPQKKKFIQYWIFPLVGFVAYTWNPQINFPILFSSDLVIPSSFHLLHEEMKGINERTNYKLRKNSKFLDLLPNSFVCKLVCRPALFAWQKEQLKNFTNQTNLQVFQIQNQLNTKVNDFSFLQKTSNSFKISSYEKTLHFSSLKNYPMQVQNVNKIYLNLLQKKIFYNTNCSNLSNYCNDLYWFHSQKSLKMFHLKFLNNKKKFEKSFLTKNCPKKILPIFFKTDYKNIYNYNFFFNNLNPISFYQKGKIILENNLKTADNVSKTNFSFLKNLKKQQNFFYKNVQKSQAFQNFQKILTMTMNHNSMFHYSFGQHKKNMLRTSLQSKKFETKNFDFSSISLKTLNQKLSLDLNFIFLLKNQRDFLPHAVPLYRLFESTNRFIGAKVPSTLITNTAHETLKNLHNVSNNQKNKKFLNHKQRFFKFYEENLRNTASQNPKFLLLETLKAPGLSETQTKKLLFYFFKIHNFKKKFSTLKQLKTKLNHLKYKSKITHFFPFVFAKQSQTTKNYNSYVTQTTWLYKWIDSQRTQKLKKILPSVFDKQKFSLQAKFDPFGPQASLESFGPQAKLEPFGPSEKKAPTYETGYMPCKPIFLHNFVLNKTNFGTILTSGLYFKKLNKETNSSKNQFSFQDFWKKTQSISGFKELSALQNHFLDQKYLQNNIAASSVKFIKNPSYIMNQKNTNFQLKLFRLGSPFKHKSENKPGCRLGMKRFLTLKNFSRSEPVFSQNTWFLKNKALKEADFIFIKTKKIQKNFFSFLKNLTNEFFNLYENFFVKFHFVFINSTASQVSYYKLNNKMKLTSKKKFLNKKLELEKKNLDFFLSESSVFKKEKIFRTLLSSRYIFNPNMDINKKISDFIQFQKFYKCFKNYRLVFQELESENLPLVLKAKLEPGQVFKKHRSAKLQPVKQVGRFAKQKNCQTSLTNFQKKEFLIKTLQKLKFRMYKNKRYNNLQKILWLSDDPFSLGDPRFTTKNEKRNCLDFSEKNPSLQNSFSPEALEAQAKLERNTNKKMKNFQYNKNFYMHRKTKLSLNKTIQKIGFIFQNHLAEREAFITPGFRFTKTKLFANKKQFRKAQVFNRKLEVQSTKNLDISSKYEIKQSSNLSFFNKQKYLQKKRRRKKLKLENRRRKKRKRFYPRPVWLRYNLYRKFLNARYNKKFLNTEKNLTLVLSYKKTQTTEPKKQTLKLKKLKYNFKTDKKQLFKALLQRNTKQKWGNFALDTNSIEKNSLKKFVLATKIPIYFNKNYYKISNQILNEFMPLYWKSYWLRNNLTPYMNRIRKNLNYQKFLTVNEMQQEESNTDQFFLTTLLGFSNVPHLNSFSFSSSESLIPPKTKSETSSEPNIWKEDFIPTQIRFKQTYKKFSLEKTPICFYSNKKTSFEKMQDFSSSNMHVIEKLRLIKEHDRILFQRISEIIKNVKYNITLDASSSLTCYKLPKSKYNLLNKSSKTPETNSLLNSLKSSLFQQLDPNFSLFSAFNIASLNSEKSTLLKPYGSQATLRVLWAFNKTNLFSFKEKNSIKNLWETYKNIEQSKSNQTKKFLKKTFYNKINNPFCSYSFSKNTKVFSFLDSSSTNLTEPVRSFSDFSKKNPSQLTWFTDLIFQTRGEFYEPKTRPEGLKSSTKNLRPYGLKFTKVNLRTAGTHKSTLIKNLNNITSRKFQNIQKKLFYSSNVTKKKLFYLKNFSSSNKNFRDFIQSNRGNKFPRIFQKKIPVHEIFHTKEQIDSFQKPLLKKSSTFFWWSTKNFVPFYSYSSPSSNIIPTHLAWNEIEHTRQLGQTLCNKKNLNKSIDLEKNLQISVCSFICIFAVFFHLCIFINFLKIPELRSLLKFQLAFLYKILNIYFITLNNFYNLVKKCHNQIKNSFLRIGSLSKNSFKRKDVISFEFQKKYLPYKFVSDYILEKSSRPEGLYLSENLRKRRYKSDLTDGNFILINSTNSFRQNTSLLNWLMTSKTLPLRSGFVKQNQTNWFEKTQVSKQTMNYTKLLFNTKSENLSFKLCYEFLKRKFIQNKINFINCNENLMKKFPSILKNKRLYSNSIKFYFFPVTEDLKSEAYKPGFSFSKTKLFANKKQARRPKELKVSSETFRAQVFNRKLEVQSTKTYINTNFKSKPMFFIFNNQKIYSFNILKFFSYKMFFLKNFGALFAKQKEQVYSNTLALFKDHRQTSKVFLLTSALVLKTKLNQTKQLKMAGLQDFTLGNQSEILQTKHLESTGSPRRPEGLYLLENFKKQNRLYALQTYSFVKFQNQLSLSIPIVMKLIFLFGLNSIQLSYKFLLKLIEIIESFLLLIYKFLEKPAELMIESIAQVFLIEWISDICTFIPETLDKNLWESFQKISRPTKLLGFFYFQHSPYFSSESMLSALNSKNIGHEYLTLTAIPFSFIFFNTMKLSFTELWDSLLKPDMDLITRQKKGIYYMNIWGEIFIQAAEKYQMNVASLVTNNLEQEKFMERLLKDPEIFSLTYSKNLKFQKNLIFKNFNKIEFLKNKTFRALHFSETKSKLFANTKHSPGGKQSNKNLEISKNSVTINQHIISSCFGGQSTESDLFLDIAPPKSFQSMGSLQSPNNFVGPILCEVYSGLFLKKVSKNILLVTKQTNLKLKNSKTFSIAKQLKQSEFSLAKSVKTCDFSNKKSNLQYKNVGDINNSSNTQIPNSGSFLIEALAGETEMKLIIDNAKRYASHFYNKAIGIRLLKDVFMSIALHTPSFFLIEDIHFIGEKRPMLLGNFVDENAHSDTLNLEQDEVHFQNQYIYQLSRHKILDYKRPYKGDSLFIPTNIYKKKLYRKNYRLGSSLGDHENSYTQVQIYKNQSLNIKKQKKHPLPLQFLQKVIQTTTNNLETSQTKTPSLVSRLQKTSEEFFAPPSTSPFTILMMKDKKRMKLRKINSHLRDTWNFINPQNNQKNYENSAVDSTQQSIRSKIAELADITLRNFSGSLDMITDLLVIVDSVRSNRGFVVFATTPIPSILDPALRRPGRFDETLCLPEFSFMYESQIFQRKNQSLQTSLPIMKYYWNRYGIISSNKFISNHLDSFPIHKNPELNGLFTNSTQMWSQSLRNLSKNKLTKILFLCSAFISDYVIQVDFLKNQTRKYFNKTIQFYKNSDQLTTLFVLFSSSLQYKNFILCFLAPKVVDFFYSSRFNAFSTKNGCLPINSYTRNFSITKTYNFSFSKHLEKQCFFHSSADSNLPENFIFSLLQKRYLFHKNFIVSKMLALENLSNSLKEPPGPPISEILMPSKKYEAFKVMEQNFIFKNSFSIYEKMHAHQKQRFLKKLYNQPIQVYFKSHTKFNDFTTFVNSFKELGSLNAKNSVSKTLLLKGSSTNYYYKTLYIRHRFSITNQWWNAQLPEHNMETTFLSDVDWRSMYVQSYENNKKVIQKDQFIDFSDADQHYNPRIRKWIFNNNFVNKFDFENIFTYEIYYHFLMQSFYKTYNYFDKNRELLDYFIFTYLQKGSILKLQSVFILSRFYKK
jgi:hypothetical protein